MYEQLSLLACKLISVFQFYHCVFSEVFIFLGVGGIVTVPSNKIFKKFLAVEYLKPLGFIVTWYLRFYVNCSQY